MLSRIARVAIGAALVSACAPVQSSRLEQHTASSSAWPDECSQLPGYSAFRRELERAIDTQDTTAFIALLHPRHHSKGPSGRAANGDYRWSFGRYGTEAAWLELQELLRFGCVQRGDKLLLPAMAELVYDMSVDTDFDMAITDLAVRTKPDASAAVLRTFKQGQLVRTVTYDSPPGWVVVLVDEQEGFVRAEDIRSPHDFQLELIREDGRWYIHEFGSGI